MLWIGDAFEVVEEELLSIEVVEIKREFWVVVKGRADLFWLTFSKQAMVDEVAVEILADCLSDKGSGNRGINAAREGADDLLVADLLSDLLNHAFGKGFAIPVLLGFDGFEEEFLEVFVFAFFGELTNGDIGRELVSEFLLHELSAIGDG